MDTKIISSLIGSVFIAFSFVFAVPILYAVIELHSFYAITIFLTQAILTAVIGVALARYGKKHRHRLQILDSALSMFLIFPLVAAIGMFPFIITGWLSPFDSMLETVSDLTSAGLSLLSPDAPYILRVWQSTLMWFGSLIFLIMLVTLMPEVGGCFGLSTTLLSGQLFSPFFGQMNIMSQRMIKTYTGLTLISFSLFKLAGLNFWDALLMAMRCISTGGGNFFPENSNAYVEYAAIFSMLLACGNFLLYYRLSQTLPPPRSGVKEKFFRRGINYIKRVRQNFFDNVKTFFSNSEVKTCTTIIFFNVLINFFVAMNENTEWDPILTLRYVIFNVVSYISTTGISLMDFEMVHDFNRFLIFMMAVLGGCMGSVTGGLKMVRVLVLLKTAAAELKKTIHPHMITNVRINNITVPPTIVGRILGFFFIACLMLFVSSALLSFMGPKFSEAVAISAVCMTNVGILPQIVDPTTFLNLPEIAKVFCTLILITGRLEIFAILILLASLKPHRGNFKW